MAASPEAASSPSGKHTVIDLSESPGILPASIRGDMKDQLEELIDAAHKFYGDYSGYEVMDLDRPAIIPFPETKKAKPS